MSDGTPRPVLHGIASIPLAFADAIWTPDMPPIPAVRPGGGDCWWRYYRVGRVGGAAPMCLVQEDHISNAIASKGHWYDCLLLRRLWYAPTADGKQGGLFLDIGSNIGSCTLEFLLYTDAVIIAVEPNPFNLYHLTRSLHRFARINPSIRSRVVVVTLALGDRLQLSSMHTPDGNAGNSFVVVEPSNETAEHPHYEYRALNTAPLLGSPPPPKTLPTPSFMPSPSTARGKKRRDRQSRTFQRANISDQTVRLARFDDVFPHTAFDRVRLAKVDVEGFECKVLSGARRALGSSKIDRITAEVSLLGSAWIQSRVNCSRERIERELLDNMNYETTFRYTMTEATVVAQLRSGPQVTCSGTFGCNNLPNNKYYTLQETNVTSRRPNGGVRRHSRASARVAPWLTSPPPISQHDRTKRRSRRVCISYPTKVCTTLPLWYDALCRVAPWVCPAP